MRRDSSKLQPKQRIAQVAAGLVQHDQVIILDGGTTTCWWLNTCLPTLSDRYYQIVPPPAAVALKDHSSIRRSSSADGFIRIRWSPLGPLPLKSCVKSGLIFVCWGFAVCIRILARTQNLEEAGVKQAMIESAAEVVALVSAEFRTAASYAKKAR